jgi:hypothetical protein
MPLLYPFGLINFSLMEEKVKKLFERYQQFFLQALHDNIDLEEVTSSYATAFIAATPAGVMVGENDEKLSEAMKQGFAYYRRIGTKDMQLRQVSILPIDNLHCLARVAWTATYDRPAGQNVSIDFEVHYLVQQLDDEPKIFGWITGEPKIFGWITGDEQRVLKEHGII